VTLDRGADQRVDVVPAPDVGLLKERRAARSGNDIERRVPAFDGLLGDIRNDDTRPSLGEADGNRATDARTRTCDEQLSFPRVDSTLTSIHASIFRLEL